MLNYHIAPAAVEHLLPVAARMRAADRREVWASHRMTPYESLIFSLEASRRAWTGFIDDNPVMVWGVADDSESGLGRPWMLATDGLARGHRVFLRLSRRYVAKLQAGYRRLENYVHAGNRLSLRWLKWCGFQIDEAAPVLFNGEKFYKFWREA
jgi:hypothetical protein